ncbi:MAG: twin-arginine translocase subunit TatC [Bdellovibrionota bacterium]
MTNEAGFSGDNKDADDGLLPEGGKVMSLLDHLGELRGRIIKSLLAVIAFFVFALFFSREIIEFLKQPLLEVLPANANSLHFTGPMDVFIVSIKVSFLASLLAACPVWIYQFWRFVEPALYEHERKWILPFIFVSTALFISGVAFCYFIIFPMTLNFLIGLGTEVATSIITITDYTSLLVILVVAFGLVFQTPLILVLLAVLDLIDVNTLAKNRRFVIVGILTVSAILTPPDPMSQVGLAVPMYVMFEVSILIIRFIKRERSEKV